MGSTIAKNDIEQLSERVKRRILERSSENPENPPILKYLGYGNTKKIEPIPNYVQAECETVFKGQNNTWITLGRDRPGSLATGYGGSGDSHAGAIDICVGRSARQAQSISKRDKELAVESLVENGILPDNILQVHSDFKSDAARIYISQKTNIDDNFGITPGKQGSAYPRSAIALKADLIRIVARENIKLVTRTDDTNSQNGGVNAVGGIDLIAGNDDSDLQPLVKGNNLVELLNYMLDDIKNLTSTVMDMALTQQAYELILTTHTHPWGPGLDPFTAPLPGAGPSVSVGVGTAAKSIKSLLTTYPDCVIGSINTVLENIEFTKAFGGSHILSKKNHTN